MSLCDSEPISAMSQHNNSTDQEFPALPKGKPSATKKVKSLALSNHSKTTEILKIPLARNEGQNIENGLSTVGKKYDAQRKICVEVAKVFGVEINLNTSKNNILTVIISGEPMKVAQAKRGIAAELQQQETVRLSVPAEYHGFLIGKKGERLQEFESTTLTRITIPPSNSSEPNIITITGPRGGVIEAQQRIIEAVQKQAQNGFERLTIPKIYHPFICGPNNQSLNDLKFRTDTKINVPPPLVAADDITISGKRDGVAQAAREIQAIYEDRLKTTKTITVNIKRSQHRIVVGPRGSGIADVLAQTGVSVELPMDSVSEEITLRGKPEDLGRALSMVYERAQSSVTEVVHAPNHFHKLLIGRRGAKLSELLEGYERIQVEFKQNADEIMLEGPPEEVEVVMKRLQTRLEELQMTVARTTVSVNPKYYRHIIGKQGAKIDRLREYKVQIKLPTDIQESNEIVIEGDPAGVEKAKQEIQQMVEKMENEKCKDVIIEPYIQRLLVSGLNGSPPPIRAIYTAFPKVSIVWPENDKVDAYICDNPSKSIVQLRGERQYVDLAAEKLYKLIKVVVEENYRQEIRICKEFRAGVFGREFGKIRKLMEETKTHLQYPSPGDENDVFTVVGREENVTEVIRQLEEMQKKLANVKEIVVSVPSELLTKFTSGNTPSLRSICEQCEGVHIRFVKQAKSTVSRANSSGSGLKSYSNEIILLGPEGAVKKAEQLIEELNAKVSEMVAEDVVHTDPRFHGFLIGRNAVNITQFRKRHNVELIFPDRLERDAARASLIRIVGPTSAVSAAKQELLEIIKSLEDEVEHVLQVDPDLLLDITQYRRTFPSPDFERVRIILPRLLPNKPVPLNDDIQAEHTCEAVNIKFIGSKAAVDTAIQYYQSIIADIKSHITREFPLTDQSQVSTLERNRFQLPELERIHKVYIRLVRPTESIEADQFTCNKQIEPSVLGVLVITGPPDRIDLTYEEGIKPLLPIEEMFPLAQEFHRNLITSYSTDSSNPYDQSRRFAKEKTQPNTNNPLINTPLELSKAAEIRQTHSVHIKLPPAHVNGSNFVALRGTPTQIAAAKLDLIEWVKQCEQIKADKLARSYELQVKLPTRFLPTILSYRTSLYEKYQISIRLNTKSNEVNLHVPDGIDDLSNSDKQIPQLNGDSNDNSVEGQCDITPVSDTFDSSMNDNSPDEQLSSVILRGYEEKVNQAKTELDDLVCKLSNQVTESLYIPAEVHSYLIGSRGSAVQKFIREFNVRVEFPKRNSSANTMDMNTVLVSGDPHDVDLACDYLINRANELIERLESQERNSRPKLVQEQILPS